jgi:alkaline phosphatase
MTIRPFCLTICAAALALGGCTTTNNYNYPDKARAAPAASETQAAGKAKNVILFIGDGMGVSTVTAARIYAGQKQGQSGEEYVLPFETFDNVALVKTYNTDAQVADSAGTASAMHTGVKTRIGVLGYGPGVTKGDCASGSGHELGLLGEEVKQRGLALGIVSTARLTHATPASVYARSVSRDWEGDTAIPEDQRGRGCSDIAQQLVGAPFDVALGGGSVAFFGKQNGGLRLDDGANLPADWAAATGGHFVTTAADLAAAPADAPLLGLFSPSHMTYMAAAAVTRLAGDRDGFYLMVESGRIDHGHHAGQAGYALEEAVEFARAIQWAIDNTDPAETLIMVTADHSHVFTIAGYPRRGNDILGLVVPPAAGGERGDDPMLAADGKPYTTLGYANGPGAVKHDAGGGRPIPETGVMAHQQALVPMGSETHAGEDVALYANGPGAGNVRGVMEQNLIYDVIRTAFGWDAE